MSIKNTLRELLNKSIDIPLEDIKIRIENSNNEIYYTSNIISILEKRTNNKANIIYNDIKNNIKENKVIETIELIDNNLLKITIKKDYLLDNLNTIIDKENNYGKNNLGNNKKINIELTLDNLEIDNYLNTIINIDNISRIMEFSGYNIEKEIYIKEEKYLPHEDIIKNKLDNYRIYFEKYSNNKKIEEEYLIEDILNKIRFSNKCYIEENNILFKSANKESDEKYILIDNMGNYTEFSKHIAHIYEKRKNKYDSIIIYIDNEENYINNINEIINDIDDKKDTIIIRKINKSSPISTTTNINKIRYMYLVDNYNLDEIEKNYNKIITITSKLDRTIKKINNKIDQYNNINSNITYNILNKLIEFEDVIISACQYKEPSLLINYAIELINLLNIIIESNSFNNDNTIKIFKSSKIIMNNILKLTGLIPEDEI